MVSCPSQDAYYVWNKYSNLVSSLSLVLNLPPAPSRDSLPCQGSFMHWRFCLSWPSYWYLHSPLVVLLPHTAWLDSGSHLSSPLIIMNGWLCPACLLPGNHLFVWDLWAGIFVWMIITIMKARRPTNCQWWDERERPSNNSQVLAPSGPGGTRGSPIHYKIFRGEECRPSGPLTLFSRNVIVPVLSVSQSLNLAD